MNWCSRWPLIFDQSCFRSSPQLASLHVGHSGTTRKYYFPKLAPILLFYLGERVKKACSVGDPVATGCMWATQEIRYFHNPCMLSSWTKPEGCDQGQ